MTATPLREAAEITPGLAQAGGTTQAVLCGSNLRHNMMKDKPTGSAPPPSYPHDQSPAAKIRAEAESEARKIKATTEQEFDRLKHSAEQKAGETKTTFKEEAHHLAEEAGDAGSKIAAHQKQALVAKIRHYEDAIRAASTTLREEEENILAGPAEMAANQLKRAAEYLQNHEPGDFIADVESVARRRPELVFGGLFFVGFAASRFLKASRSKPASKRSATDWQGHEPSGLTATPAIDPALGATQRPPTTGGMPASPLVTGATPPPSTQPSTHPTNA